MMTATESEPSVATEDDQYQQLLAHIRDRFTAATKGQRALYSTNATGMFDTLLAALPADRRQHYTCNACRRFVDRFGGLVTIGVDGAQTPILWTEAGAPPFFRAALASLARAVGRAKVDGVFLCSDATWGMPQNKSDKAPFVWRHMAVTPDRALIHRPTALLTTGQVMAEKVQDYGILCRGLAEFPIDVVRQAHALLTNGQLYRSEKCIGVAKWLLDLHEARAATKSTAVRDNLTWRAVATAPAGFCHVRSSMIGTLLEDVAAGLAFADVKRRFDEKMSPANYQRAQAAPSAGNIAQAERVVATLEAAGALERRYATIDEVQRIWQPAAPKADAPTGSVFGHLAPKGKPAAAAPMVVPAQTMTWEKFRRTVLPTATTAEVQVPPTVDRFMALVTASKADAPPILQWDAEGRRNPVSWYYAGGIDAEIKRRVLGAGGQHGDVDIRASLVWNNRNDLDLHVVTPRGEHIFFGSKRSMCGGWLDVDMNVNGETDTPVENIRWPRGTATAGRYRVYVQNYRFHEWAHRPTPFRVELEVNGDVYHHDGIASPREQVGYASDVTVAEFDYRPGQRLTAAPPSMRAPAASGASAWGVTPGQWTKVTGISESPNMWGETPMPQHGQHVFFLLDGCKDTTPGVGRGFFVETLRAEFRPIRSTLEAYAAGATIAGAESATACGIGMSDQTPWDLNVRVTTPGGVSTYRIDRWD